MRLLLNREIIADGWAWFALMLLLGVTTLVAFLPLGVFSLPVALAIGGLKTAIVLTVFMKLLRGPRLALLFGSAGLFWLAIMLTLIWTDYLARADFFVGN